VSPPGPRALATFTKEFARLKMPPPTVDERWHVIRGMSFVEKNLDPTGLWDNSTVPERGSALNIGFRCVKDAR
jgi:hypothetical protein